MASEIYQVNQSLAADDIRYLRQLYDRLAGENIKYDYNLFNLKKKNVPPNIPKFNEIRSKLVAECGIPDRANYFLEYTEGSFCLFHQDNPLTVDRTAVTLIDMSDDIVGGEAIIKTKIHPDQLIDGVTRPSIQKIDVTKHTVVPVVVPHPVGSTLWYNQDVIHGVGKVHSGRRIVLITWFRKK